MRTDRWDEASGDVVDASFIEYPWLEGRAARICSYEHALVPGLLQTHAYAATVIRSMEGQSIPSTTIDRYVQLRMDRQEVLDRPEPPHFISVLNPGVLGPFSIFSMPDPYPAVAYIENLAGRLYIEMPKAEKLVHAYDALLEAALDVHQSVRLIAAVAEELS